MVINGNLYPNDGVYQNCEKRRIAGKRNFSFYSCYWFKSKPDDENPMSFVESTNLYDSDYTEWKEIINSTCYYNHDDGDVHVGKLSIDWNEHKKGSYVVYHSPALNGHWAAVENTRKPFDWAEYICRGE